MERQGREQPRRGVRLRGGRLRGQIRGNGRRFVPDEIRATIVDHVLNHGLTMAEAGRRVQPNIGRTTVSSIVQTFRRENRCVIQKCALYCNSAH